MSELSKRLIRCFNELHEQGVVRSGRQFALSLKYQAQSWSDVMNGKRDAPIELIRRACETYRINPTFLFLGEGEPFLKDEDKKNLKVLTILTDVAGNEKILHVPVAAQAGYADNLSDPIFMQELPAYSLPDHRFSQGTFRSFDVQGDSMEPVLFEGDRLVCSFQEPDFWAKSIGNKQVYVVVTEIEILVKRIENQIDTNEKLVLHSDNTWYQSIEIPVSSIRELWHVKLKISPFLHTPPENTSDIKAQIDQLKDTIRAQSRMLEHLSDKIEGVRD